MGLPEKCPRSRPAKNNFSGNPVYRPLSESHASRAAARGLYFQIVDKGTS